MNTPNMVTNCSDCGSSSSKLRRCTVCYKVAYCNQICQRKHWPMHKPLCIKEHRLVQITQNMQQFKGVQTIEDIETYYPNALLLMQHVTGKTLCEEKLLFSLSKTVPLPILYNHVIIKDSNIPFAGKGVYATMDIPSNNIVTYYPAHYIQRHCDDRILFDPYTEECPTDDKLTLISTEYSLSYSRCYNEMYSFIGDPTLLNNPLLLGHMINDVAGNIFSGIAVQYLKNLNTFKSLLIKYYQTVKEKRNCTTVKSQKYPVIGIIPTRDLIAGEELLTEYGIEYWLRKEYGDDYTEKYPFIATHFRRCLLEPECLSFAKANDL